MAKRPEIIVVVGKPRIRRVRSLFMPYECAISSDDIKGHGWTQDDAYNNWLEANVTRPRAAFRQQVENEAARWIENHLHIIGRT